MPQWRSRILDAAAKTQHNQRNEHLNKERTSSLSLFSGSCFVSLSLSFCLYTHITHTCRCVLHTCVHMISIRCIFNFRETVNFVLKNTFFWNWVLTWVTLLFRLLHLIKMKCNGLNLKPAHTTVSVSVKWFLSFSRLGTYMGRDMGYCSINAHWLLLCDRIGHASIFCMVLHCFCFKIIMELLKIENYSQKQMIIFLKVSMLDFHVEISRK